MRALGGDEPSYDHDLHKHLGEAGYLDLGRDRNVDSTPALVAEAVARKLGVVAGRVPRARAAQPRHSTSRARSRSCRRGRRVRRGSRPTPRSIVTVADDRVCVVHPKPGGVAAGRLADRVAGRRRRRRRPAATSCTEVDRRPRFERGGAIALALELVGSMRAALDLTVAHVSDRLQFGRPIGSFQAVQHGLAKCAVAVEGARWLAYEAAWSGDADGGGDGADGGGAAPPSGCAATPTSSRGRSASRPSTTCTCRRCACRRWRSRPARSARPSSPPPPAAGRAP